MEEVTLAELPETADISAPPSLTVADAPRARSLDAAPTTITSSADALRRDEIARTQKLGLTGMSLAAAALAASPLLGGDPVARTVLVASLVIVIVTNAWLWRLAADPIRWPERRQQIATIWILATVAVVGICYFFGPLSGVLVAPMLGIYFVGLGSSRRVGAAVYGIFAVAHAALLVLIASGAIRDRGLLAVVGVPPEVQLISGGLAQGVLLAGFLLARSSRRVTKAAVDELERAMRQIAQREAQLQEARQEIERALRPGGVGRYTDHVFGSFRLGAVIGRGAMGEVYDGLRVGDGEAAAIKVLHGDAFAEPGHVERFRREAQVVSRLRSPHVVRVLEVGDAPVPYLAMERLHGVDLAGHLRERGRLPLPEVVELVRQVARGLDEAWRAGIVHRDLKPQNVFRAADGAHPRWTILDFGVSKLAGHTGTLTQGRVVGTPQYMAPEQASGFDVDHRADVYALAALAFRALAGRPLFPGGPVPQVLYQVVHVAPPRPSSLVELPAGVDEVLLAGLAKRADDRPATATALAAALAAAAR